jgi:hypothetical protein
LSRVPRDESELDPETWVAAQILKAQPPAGLTRLPGMTPDPSNLPVRLGRLIRSGSRLRALHSHMLGGGPTCPNCRCGRRTKETE